MKKDYTSPRAEKLEFDYSKVVTSSESGRRGDNGWQHGCEGGPNPGEHGNPDTCRQG